MRPSRITLQPRSAGRCGGVSTPILSRQLPVVRWGTLAAIALSACSREPMAPVGRAALAPVHGVRAAVEPAVPVTTVLDSFTIGGVYSALPRGGYSQGRYNQSLLKEWYAGTVWGHPTGLVFPIGLPMRILAEGVVVSRSTQAWRTDYCEPYGATDPWCSISSFTYSVHGMVPGPGVTTPYWPGSAFSLAWSPLQVWVGRMYAEYPDAEAFRGRVPAADTIAVRELYFWRARCCYGYPWDNATGAWDSYEGQFRFGAVPDDGGQAELGVPAVLRVLGRRTDVAQVAPADFTVETVTGDSIVTTRWWYVRAVNNVFDGEPLQLVPSGLPYPTVVPRYPDAQHTSYEALGACDGLTTCRYLATATGAVLVQVTLADGRTLAARNLGPHVKIRADSRTVARGDTTVFRATAQGAD